MTRIIITLLLLYPFLVFFHTSSPDIGSGLCLHQHLVLLLQAKQSLGQRVKLVFNQLHVGELVAKLLLVCFVGFEQLLHLVAQLLHLFELFVVQYLLLI